jgi:hypothetical protein
LTCYVYTGRLPPKGDAAEPFKSVKARQLEQKSSVTPTLVTQTPSLKRLDTADPAQITGYRDFTLSVTEYCEASPGTPLKARGWWSLKDSSAGQKVWFGGDQATYMSLGYPGVSLQVGPCKTLSTLCGEHGANQAFTKTTSGPVESHSITADVIGIKIQMALEIVLGADLPPGHRMGLIVP